MNNIIFTKFGDNEPCCDIGDFWMQCDNPAKAETKWKEAEKYKWHDLRKDPNDLPEGKDCYSSFVIVATEFYTDFCTIARMDFLTNEWIEIGTGDDIIDECGKVIAWRYIEPFNDDEKSVSSEVEDE